MREIGIVFSCNGVRKTQVAGSARFSMPAWVHYENKSPWGDGALGGLGNGDLPRLPEAINPLRRDPCRCCTSLASILACGVLRKPYILSLAAFMADLSSTMGSG